MFTGFAFLVLAALFIKFRKFEAFAALLFFVGGGLIAVGFNPLKNVGGGGVIELLTWGTFVAMALAMLTKKREAWLNPVAFIAPFLWLTSDGLVGELCRMFFQSIPWADLYKQVV